MTTNLDLPQPASRVLQEPPKGMAPMQGSLANLVISVASAADTITPWGADPRTRDLQLRQFWPSEDYFASALFTTIAQYVAFGWSLTGPPRTVRLSQRVLNNVQSGGGWEALMTPVLIDYFTQDNGAFIEIVRADDDPDSPVITLNHLDAFRCIRTGRRDVPVLYIDLYGKLHELKWYQVITLCEMPAPQQEARGIGYCALTRVLRHAQIMRDISVVRHEKASGRFTRQVHLVSGVQTRMIEDAMAQNQAAASNMGLMKYIQPVILASLDPTAKVSKETIDLASIPEDFDEKSIDSYILLMSIAFAIDYQSLAPLSGGGLGSGAQSKVLNMKSRGKGPGLFMKKVARIFNFHGVLPNIVKFDFGEQDIAEQMELAELRKSRASTREMLIRSGEITKQVARQMAVDDGDLDERYLIMMGEENATEEIVATSINPVTEVTPDDVKKGEPAPKEAAQIAEEAAKALPARPANSNDKRMRGPSNNTRRTPGGTPENGARA